MKQDILLTQTVAILCDGNNIERSIHEQSGNPQTMVNFDTLIPRLLNGRGLSRLIYFREGKNISYKLAERLHAKYYGSVIPCHKSADIPLSIKATQVASKVDTIIIMSGDSDYIDLVIHLKSEGVRVEIAAVKKTTSRMLIEQADYFHEIVKNDWFAYNSPRRRSSPRKTKTTPKEGGNGAESKPTEKVTKVPAPKSKPVEDSGPVIPNT
ncbi:TPA: NYN domain-containing protein [Candidatus Woesearchaeota archaeon]|jgi:uncharacterized LabA/DUF88 family protein|nr:hypothetical protein [archaeon]HIJ11642.1 NYN domain-containing protein [Candidatus Woesearchaeota archaeon]|tara:strand:- start:129 stop:758 length:630 start_codon:yes stop_codon:yes gene_type:complete